MVSPAEYFAIEIMNEIDMVDSSLGLPKDEQAWKLRGILIDWYEKNHKPLLAKYIQLSIESENV
jgi:hypothetical protein